MAAHGCRASAWQLASVGAATVLGRGDGAGLDGGDAGAVDGAAEGGVALGLELERKKEKVFYCLLEQLPVHVN